ncbi:MAG TPA: helix-turn-helix transcriptional regulator [Thermoanaerobaculia bacterium]|nr:helix-turn-helix transcriptional regulator [Thermoanaerobaculia bacterium]
MGVGHTAGEVFGARVREIRQKRGMTQVELGERLGFPQNRVSEIENGSRSPTLVTILRLAIALECKPSALLTSFDQEDLPKLLPK